MKTKSLLLTIAVTFGMSALIMAQNVPNYVPTNGLVGWWPFNGNANDESGNGNNGTVNGATLTSDRFGNSNSAYFFNGNSNNSPYIIANSPINNNTTSFSFSTWLNKSNPIFQWFLMVYSNNSLNSIELAGGNVSGQDTIGFRNFLQSTGNPNYDLFTGVNWTNNQWVHFVVTYSNNLTLLYVNGILETQLNGNCSIPIDGNLFIGKHSFFSASADQSWNGNIDDIGCWNRALNQQEINNLFNSSNCANNTTITPAINSLVTGIAATFTATTSDPNPSFVWQSDFGQGFQSLNDFGNYSGTNTAILNIANVQLANHNQPIRVITTSGECIDTSNIAIISIADTCINTITDTTLITVTDTLIINSTITSLNPPNNSNTIKVFPNPTNDHITIDYGNFSIMTGYQLQIENSLGQQVFQTDITQQSDYLNLSSWGGNGLYFVHIIDPQGNTIDIRKIVLQ